jgi:acetyl esterase/lipase
MNSYDLERKIIDLLLVLNGTKKMYRTEKAARHYLEKNRTLNDLPYRVPAQVKRDWEEISIDGIQCLTRKGKTETTIFYLHGGAYFLRPIKFHFMMLDDLAKATGFNIILPYIRWPRTIPFWRPMIKFNQCMKSRFPISISKMSF